VFFLSLVCAFCVSIGILLFYVDCYLYQVLFPYY